MGEVTTCPCCGHELAADRLVVSTMTSDAVFNGKTVRLSRLRARLLNALARAWPNTVTHEQLWLSVWGDHPVANERNSVSVNITQMRHQLEELGIEIKNVHAMGYRIELPATTGVDRFSTRRRQSESVTI